MKRVVYLFVAVLSLFVLVACNTTAATAAFDDVEKTKSSVTFTVTVDDPDAEITGYTYVKLYDADEELINSQILNFEEGETSLEDEVTFSSLDAETTYTLVVEATIEKRNVDLATEEFTTFAESEVTITTVEEFMDMTSNRSGDYILANDLDFTDVEYTIPFGSGKSFLGTFDGQGYTISNITIDELAVYTGVFGTVSSATIENLNIDNVNMGTAEAPLELATSTRIGFAIGYISSQSAEINNVHVTNSSLYIKTASTISTFVGGLIGDMRGSIENSSVENAVIQVETTSTADVRIGGLVGSLWEDATVNESYSTGSIDFTFAGEGLGDTDNSAIDIGGLVGRNEATDVLSPVKDVYSTVDITADFTYNTEDGTEEANYSVNVGGLIGYSSAYVESGFYAGSIELTQTSTEFETNTYKLFSVGGLIGKYFARKALNELVRFGNGESITLTVSEDVNLKFSQLVAFSVNADPANFDAGVVGSQSATINTEAVTDIANEIAEPTTYFTSDWVQAAFDAINVG